MATFNPKKARIIITTADIQLLTGFSRAASCRLYNYCLTVLDKKPASKRKHGPDGRIYYERGQKLTIKEFCTVEGLPENEVREKLGLL